MQGRWAGLGLWSFLLVFPVMGWSQELPRTEPTEDAAPRLSRGHSSLKLTRSVTGSDKSSTRDDKTPSKQSSWLTTSGSLVIVIALILGCGYLLKRTRSFGNGVLPDELIQVLGRKPLDPRTTLQMVRCGSKILVLSNSIQHGVRTLSEITNPVDVETILDQYRGTFDTSLVQSTASESNNNGHRVEPIAPNSTAPFPLGSTSKITSGAPRVTAHGGQNV